MKKKRFLSIGLLLLFCIIGVLMLYFRKLNTSGYVVVFVDGIEVQKEPLTVNKEFDIRTKYGINQVSIINSSVCVRNADCANQICVHTGCISNGGDIISCLPHHLIITIEKEGQVDTVAY